MPYRIGLCRTALDFCRTTRFPQRLSPPLVVVGTPALVLTLRLVAALGSARRLGSPAAVPPVPPRPDWPGWLTSASLVEVSEQELEHMGGLMALRIQTSTQMRVKHGVRRVCLVVDCGAVDVCSRAHSHVSLGAG